MKICVNDIFSKTFDSQFIRNSECQRLIVQLINRGFELRMKEKNVREYKMSNKLGYWIEKGKLEKDKFNKVLFVGKMLEKNWHFGISAAAKLYPYHILMISSHIFFTQDGTILIESKIHQHAARRKQGAKWWNNDWRTKLLGFVKYISDDENSFYLEMGSEEKITISNQPMQFVGKVSYDVPNAKNLEEESELSDLTDIDDFEEIEEGKE
jgi:uncharacterized protein YfbU (UPF0304 family)